jgi:hypothetical protein
VFARTSSQLRRVSCVQLNEHSDKSVKVFTRLFTRLFISLGHQKVLAGFREPTVKKCKNRRGTFVWDGVGRTQTNSNILKVTQSYSKCLKVSQSVSKLLKVTQSYSKLLKVTQSYSNYKYDSNYFSNFK